MNPHAIREYFATCTLGLEPALAGELRALGSTRVEEGRGGVVFDGDLASGWRACLELRSATRVQELLVDVDVKTERDLYSAVKRLPWDELLALEQTLAVEAAVRDSFLTHSGYAALLVKDAIVDAFRARCGKRPNVDVDNPHLQLHVVLRRERVKIYRSFGGESLHKRGYRPIQVKSPLNEATAAGLLLLSGWDRASGIVDPMCGSATFLIEAAMLALDRAPGLYRRFAFERWPDFDRVVYEDSKRKVAARAKDELPFALAGADQHPGAVALARRAIRSAGVDSLVHVEEQAVATYEPAHEFRTVFVNPPWGERLDETAGADVEAAWRDLGTFLHERCRGKSAFVLCGDPGLARHLRLKAGQRIPVKIGAIDCRLLRYDIRAAERSGDPPPEERDPG
jgi:putative N6-adenine-specific DNA methylase